MHRKWFCIACWRTDGRKSCFEHSTRCSKMSECFSASMLPSQKYKEHRYNPIPSHNLAFGTFPMCDGPSQMPPSPEKLALPLYDVYITLLVYTVKFLSFTLSRSAWQRFPTVLPCPRCYISYRWMMGLDAVLSDGSMSAQVRLVPLCYVHWNSFRFLKSLTLFCTVGGNL